MTLCVNAGKNLLNSGIAAGALMVTSNKDSPLPHGQQRRRVAEILMPRAVEAMPPVNRRRSDENGNNAFLQQALAKTIQTPQSTAVDHPGTHQPARIHKQHPMVSDGKSYR